MTCGWSLWRWRRSNFLTPYLPSRTVWWRGGGLYLAVHGSAVNTSCLTVPLPMRSSPAQHCLPVAALSTIPAPTQPPVRSQFQRLQKKTGSFSCQPQWRAFPRILIGTWGVWSSECIFAQFMQSSPKDGKDNIHFPSGGPGLSDFCKKIWFNFKREVNVWP